MPAWIFWIVAAAMGLLALWLLHLGLVGDRARGRRRCPRCWYDMAGLESRRCPECGRQAKREGALFRPRRRWRFAAAGVVVGLMTAGVGVTPKILRDGWVSVAPTTLLLLFVPDAEKEWEITTLKIHPITAELKQRAWTKPFGDMEWRIALSRSGIIRHRRRWPVDEPFVIAVHRPEWLRAHYVTLRRRDNGAKAVCRHDIAGSYGAVHACVQQEFGSINATTTSITFDAAINGPFQQCSKQVRLPIQPVASAEDAIDPVSIRRVDQLIDRRLDLYAYWVDPSASGQHRLNLAIELNDADAPDLQSLAIGLLVEVRIGGELAASGECLLRSSPSRRTYRSDWLMLMLPEEPFENWTGQLPPETWSLRVRGNARASLRDFRRTEYWAGELEYPLRDLIEKSLASQ